MHLLYQSGTTVPDCACIGSKSLSDIVWGTVYTLCVQYSTHRSVRSELQYHSQLCAPHVHNLNTWCAQPAMSKIWEYNLCANNAVPAHGVEVLQGIKKYYQQRRSLEERLHSTSSSRPEKPLSQLPLAKLATYLPDSIWYCMHHLFCLVIYWFLSACLLLRGYFFTQDISLHPGSVFIGSPHDAQPGSPF